jgi:hypothetical protein
VSARPLTRRSFLVAGAGALASGLVRPVVPLAHALGPASPRLSERSLGDLRGGTASVALSPGDDLVGLEWDASAAARVELRLRGADRRWSPWVPAAGCQAPEDGAGAPGPGSRVVGAPVWSAGASALQVRASRALGGVRLHVVDVSGGVGARRLALAHALLGSPPAAAAVAPGLGPAEPRILPRSVWAQGMARPRVSPAYGAVRMAFVHHTETPNGYLAAEVPAMLRGIFVFHREVRGWNDIGYNFVVDAFGRIFEARAGGIDEPVVGAQAGGYNRESTGVAVLGAFMSRPISAPALRSLQALLAWKLSLHGVPALGRARVRVNPAGAVFSRFPAGAHVSLPRIAGHRDGDTTDCPGDALYGELPGVRGAVHALAPRPARATIALASAPLAAGAAGEAAWTLGGRLTLLGGAPIAGAPIELQLRSVAAYGQTVRESTLAEALTDAAGNWALAPVRASASRARQVWVRALYPGAGGQPGGSGAAVSEPLAVPASLTAALAAAPPSAAAPAPPAA